VTKLQFTEKESNEFLSLRVTFNTKVPIEFFAQYLVGTYDSEEWMYRDDCGAYAKAFKAEIDDDTKDEYIDGWSESRQGYGDGNNDVYGKHSGDDNTSKSLEIFLSRKFYNHEWEFIKKRIDTFPAFYTKTQKTKKRCEITAIDFITEVHTTKENARPISEITFPEPRKRKKK
jgi:hypothetical protein